MTYLHAVILAIIEGITEFLPISSTGHLVLVSHMLHVPESEFSKSFEIIIQLGAILAIVVLYWKTLLVNTAIWKRIIIAFLPTAIIGFTLYKVIKGYLIGNEVITLLALLVGGIVMIILELLYKEKSHHVDHIEKLSLRQSFLIGLCQSISMIPGVSRAGATIIGGLFVGAKRKTAVEFSFLLAVPTMLAATVLDLKETNLAMTQYEMSLLAVGFIGSFAVALVVVKLFVKFVQHNTFIGFGIYRILLAIIYWLFIL